MVAPRKNATRAPLCKGLVDVKVTPKRNDYRENHVNQHFLGARVKFRGEFCSMFSNECQLYSADDVNKIRMGLATAVSRYHNQHRFFMLSSNPTFSDHDFPNPGYLIICSGYQSQDKNAAETPEIPEVEDCIENINEITIHNSPEEQNENMSYDKLERVHYKRTTYGPAVLKLRTMKFDTKHMQMICCQFQMRK